MTKKEMKTITCEKCVEAWKVLKLFERVYGNADVNTEKALTKWVTLDELYRDLFNEHLNYNDYEF